ncbi:MAG: 50S ribosomal protein L33 [Polyangiaceae bacterium]|jgi:large subunit ribosomal protein L33
MGAAPKKDRRQPIALVCTQCSARNYKTTRSRTANDKPISLKKFCSTCNAHTVHLEAK